MHAFDPATSFGPEVAARYDDHPRGDEEADATFLADLARGRPALEFAIGTGRIALPLAAKGIQVEGIELSSHMLDQLPRIPSPHADVATPIPSTPRIIALGTICCIKVVYERLGVDAQPCRTFVGSVIASDSGCLCARDYG